MHAGWMRMRLSIMKLRIEMGNMPKRQQPDQRADKSRSPPKGISTQRENPAPGGRMQLVPNKKRCALVQ